MPDNDLIEKDMRYDEQTAYAIANRLLTRFRVFKSRLENRRLHYANDPRKDPQLGEYDSQGNPKPDNPYRDVSPYQDDSPRRVTQQVVARICENKPIFDVVPPRNRSQMMEESNNLAVILNGWMYQLQERTDINWQQAMSYGQVKDCFAVMHTYRMNDLRPAIEKKRYANLQDVPDDEMEDIFDDIDNPGGYVEKADKYKQRVIEEYAHKGIPWNVEFVNPYFFTYQKNKFGGLDKVVVAYEVDYIDYEEAFNKTKPNEYTQLPITLMSPAPGIQKGTGEALTSMSTPSSDDFDKRVTVWQFWTNDEYYEFCDGYGDGSHITGNFALKKAFKHDYPSIPYRIVWANRTFDDDPALESEPYIEGIYRYKPYYDRVMTLMSAIAELTADPVTFEQDSGTAPTPVFEDGGVSETGDESSLGKRMAPGRKIQQIQIQMTNALPQFLQLLKASLKEAEPSTGAVEIGATTAPWTARIWQTQANVGPKLLVENQAAALKWWGNFIKDWHAANPEEPMASYFFDKKTGRFNKDIIVTVDPKKIKHFEVECSISPLSSAEQLTLAQHLFEFYNQGAIQRIEFYERGWGVKNPHDYIAVLDAEKAVKPLQDLWIDTELKSRLSKRFLMQAAGEWVNGLGAGVDPYAAINELGYTEQNQTEPQEMMPGEQAQRPTYKAPSSSTGDEARLPTQQRPLPPVQAPNTMKINGIR